MNPGECPKCKSANVNYYDDDISDGAKHYHVECLDCGCMFTEINDLIYRETVIDD